MTAKVFHAHLWGTRKHKYTTLRANSLGETQWAELEPGSPFKERRKGAWHVWGT